MRIILLAFFLLSLYACDRTVLTSSSADSLPACPTTDPLEILDGTTECKPETDDPLNLRAVETPKNMVKNVASLAESASFLNICFESDQYEHMETEQALELFDLRSRLGKVAQIISDHYRDEALYLSYDLLVAKHSDDLELKKYAKEKYGPCSTALLSDVGAYASRAESHFPSSEP